MSRECTNCNIEMEKALMRAGGSPIIVGEIKKGFGAKVCAVDVYVCPKCGHIELAAEKPEIFDK